MLPPSMTHRVSLKDLTRLFSKTVAQRMDIRSELFNYEVRLTFDSPDVAEHRRIVEEAGGDWSPETDNGPDEEEPWRKPDDR